MTGGYAGQSSGVRGLEITGPMKLAPNALELHGMRPCLVIGHPTKFIEIIVRKCVRSLSGDWHLASDGAQTLSITQIMQ